MLRDAGSALERVRMQTARAQDSSADLTQLWRERERLAARIEAAAATGDVPEDLADRYRTLGRLIAESPACGPGDVWAKLMLLKELAADTPDGPWIEAIAGTIGERWILP